MKAKKFLSLLMSLAMILTALPLSGVTAFAVTNGDFEYTILADGTAEITDYTGSAETLEIPSKLDTYTVTIIGYRAFEFCHLTSITIPESVTSIGDIAFEGCKSLTEIKVDANNKNYSSQDGVLFDKNKTELILCPEGKTGIYKIPNSVTSIDERAFYDCDGLTSVTIPESVTSIGDWAFGRCDGLTSVTLPESVTSMGDWAFRECTELTSVTILSGVIGADAFQDCINLTSVSIGDSVTSIGDEAFRYCKMLTEINVDTNNKNYTSQDGVLFNKNKTELIQYPIGNERTSYNIPNSVTSIGESAFEYCSSLTSVTIPDSVKSIGGYAFGETGYYDNDLNWENGVLYIDNCLVDAKSDELPQNYAINQGTRVIADNAFEFCDSLTSVTIPDSVTSIGDLAFYWCNSLTDIYILNKECNIEKNNEDPYALTIPTETTIHGYAGSTAETFAKENGNKFVAIDGEPVTPDKQNAIGDVDGNKNITITDAKWILQNTVKSRTFTEAQAKAADLDKDGKITIVDAKWVLQIVVGLRDAQTLKPIKK